MSGDARVTIDGDASGLTRALALGANSVRDFGNSVTSALGPLKSLMDVPLQQGRINFAGQAAQVREFEASSARLATSMGRDLQQVRGALDATGISLGKRPQEVAAWASEVGKLTYNFGGAANALKGISGLAALTGRSTDAYRGLAVELANVGKVGGDTTDVIGSLATQAEMLGNKGGVAAFADQVEGLTDTISRFSRSATADFLAVTALAGTLGKNLAAKGDYAGAGRAAGGALGVVQSDPRRWERYLHKTLMDENGQIQAKEMPQIMHDIIQKAIKERGVGGARRVLMQSSNFGNEGGASMMNAYLRGDLEPGKIAALAKAGPSGAPQAALARYLGTDAGKRDTAEATLAVSSEKLLGSASLLGKAADALQRFAASNPVTSSMATAGVSAGIGSALGGLVKAGGKGGLARAAATIGSGAAASIGIVTGGVIAGGLGGALLAHEWSKAQDERYEAQERAASAEQANKNKLAQMQTDRKKKIAALEAQGVSHGMAVYQTDLPGAGAAFRAGGGASSSGGGSPAAQAAAATERGSKDIVDAIKQSRQITIINATGGPIEVAGQGQQSSAAGNQSGG